MSFDLKKLTIEKLMNEMNSCIARKKKNNDIKNKLTLENSKIRMFENKIKKEILLRKREQTKIKKQKIKIVRKKMEKAERKINSIESSLLKSTKLSTKSSTKPSTKLSTISSDKSSTKSSTKKNITISKMKRILTSTGIKYKSSMNKSELLTLVRKHNLVRKCISLI